MANFDDILKNKLEEFADDSVPSQVEINRLNRSLDLVGATRWGWRSLLLYLLLILLLGSQLFLIFSNRSLTRTVYDSNLVIDSLSQVVENHEKKHQTFHQELRNATGNPLNGISELNQIDTQLIVNDYLNGNKAFLEKLIRDALKEQNRTTGTNTLSIAKSTKKKEPLNLENIESWKRLKERNDKLSREGSKELRDRGLNNLPNNQNNIIPTQKSKTDTVVIREIAIDSNLYDSLVQQIAQINKQKSEESIEPKVPKTFAWNAGLGLKPAYSNLYLLDGRMVYGLNLFTGFNYNSRWALNAGLQYRIMNVHDYITDSTQNPVENFEQFDHSKYQIPFELEGAASGLYLPLDFQYFFHLGSIDAFARAGCDLNLITSENYKIEGATSTHFELNQMSRKMQISSYSLGLGGVMNLSSKLDLELEGGYLIGQSLDPVLLSDKNGIYLQSRLVYIIKRG